TNLLGPDLFSADTDLAEMECGENEWLEDIRRQAQRLTGLTEDLIYLSRMEEAQPRLGVFGVSHLGCGGRDGAILSGSGQKPGQEAGD
ncbi:MAG: hypothetical protein V8R55_12185, partial [Dysosmobacter sp.]